MNDEGITVTFMAEKLGIPKHTVETRINRLGIKPLSYEARYPSDTLDKIKNAKVGRPPKAKPDKPKKSPKE
jgi:hypothetical protein